LKSINQQINFENKLSIIEDDEDLVFTESNAKVYKKAIIDIEKGESINWKDYAKRRNIDV